MVAPRGVLSTGVRQTRVIMRIGVFAVLSIVAIGCTSGRVLQDSDGNSYTVKVMSDGRTCDLPPGI
jgi:hypothetical protein